MKNQISKFGLMIAILALYWPATGHCQDEDPFAQAPTVPRVAFPGQQSNTTAPRGLATWRSGESDLSKAIKKLAAAESAGDKEEAEKEVRKLLEGQYDQSLDAYEQYLEEMQAKLKELGEQLEKRRDAKDELVDLRMQMLLNDANGLAWPDSRTNSFFGNSQFGNSTFTLPRNLNNTPAIYVPAPAQPSRPVQKAQRSGR